MENRFSFHEFYNFLLFNFVIIIIFLKTVFLPTTITHAHTHDPHPRPTTNDLYPRPTTFSYTPPQSHRTILKRRIFTRKVIYRFDRLNFSNAELFTHAHSEIVLASPGRSSRIRHQALTERAWKDAG